MGCDRETSSNGGPPTSGRRSGPSHRAGLIGARNKISPSDHVKWIDVRGIRGFGLIEDRRCDTVAVALPGHSQDTNSAKLPG